MSSKHSYKIRKERCNECYGVGQIKLERPKNCANCEGSCCYKCEKCHDIFEEPELDYEYDERMRENAAEDRMDEERLGL